MTQANAILGLLAQTAIHAGVEKDTNLIDMAIQREGHNGWPCVFGSSMKGALRAHAYDEEAIKADMNAIFGAAIANAGDVQSSQAGALAVSDARLLLFPVRSLTSHFKWVSCPAALQRFINDSKRMGLLVEELPAALNFNAETKERAYVPEIAQGEQATASNGLYLEEYRFETEAVDLTTVINMLAQLINSPDKQQLLRKQLVVIDDDMFSFLVQHATTVNAHIAISAETKTVDPKGGALWYEETLPPETLLYVMLSASASRNADENDTKLEAKQVLNKFNSLFSADKYWLRIGGNETCGMGWCAVSIFGNQE